MSEAYIFASALAASADEALLAALQAAGLGKRALAELCWLGAAPLDLPGDFPVASAPGGAGQAHFTLQSYLRRLQGGERGLFALGQNGTDGCACLLLGGPAVVGRLNLLPLYRLHPAPALPANGAAAAEDFRLGLLPPPPPEESTPEDAPPVIISPAAPPPPPLLPEPPQITLFLAEGLDPRVYSAARRLPPALPGLSGLLSLLAALSEQEAWGGLSTALARGCLLTVVEKL